MLRGSLAFIVLVVCAVAGAEVVRVLARKGWRAPTMEGVSFLIAGVVLGGHGLALFPDNILSTLRVVVLFGLAWIGFVVGVQMDLRVIRRISSRMRWVGMLAPMSVAVAIAAAATAAGLSLELGLASAAIASASSPTLLENAVKGRMVHVVEAVRVLRLLLAFSGIPAIVFMAVAASLASPLVSAESMAVRGAEMVAMVVGVGAAVGWVLVALVRGVRGPMELLTLTIGGLCVLAGTTAAVGVAALPAAACAGAVVVNRMFFPHRMLRVANALSQPLLVALLVLVGASWSGGAFSWSVFGLMTVVRAATLVAVGSGVAAFAGGTVSDRPPRDLGVGLLPQGELALGLLVAVVSFFPPMPGYLEAVVAAVVCNNLAAVPWFGSRLKPLATPAGRP